MVDVAQINSANDDRDYTLLYDVWPRSEIQTARAKKRNSRCAKRRSATALLDR